MKRSFGVRLFNVFNIWMLILVMLTILFPFLYILSISVSSPQAIIEQRVTIYPIGFSLKAYKHLITDKYFLGAFFNSIWVTCVVTILSILVITPAAYSLSRPFYGRKIINYFFIFTMYFSGGLIPTYILYTKYYHLFNSYLVYILPTLVNVFYLIVIRSQLEAVPKSLIESATIDGAKELQVLFYIVIPTIIPTILAIGMFIMLASWNMWFPSMIYTDNRSMWLLQYYLRSVIADKSTFVATGLGALVDMRVADSDVVAENFQMAAIIVAAAPMLIIYPFIQKYFTKGIIAGSVKG